MKRRYWTRGPVALAVTIAAPARYREQHGMLRYVSGVMDALDGSHGPTFTFLPVVYEDDSLVVEGTDEWRDHEVSRYEVSVRFLAP